MGVMQLLGVAVVAGSGSKKRYAEYRGESAEDRGREIREFTWRGKKNKAASDFFF